MTKLCPDNPARNTFNYYKKSQDSCNPLVLGQIQSITLDTIGSRLTNNNHIDLYTKGINAHPNNMRAYCLRGQYYSSNNDSIKALADFTKAINNRLDYADAYHHRGRYYFFRSKYDDADYYYCRGEAYRNQKDFTNASKDYNEYIRFNNNKSSDNAKKAMKWI